MTKVFADISISLDGFVAGPNPTLKEPLGEGGERLHEWAFRLATFREAHGTEGGERDADDELMAESLERTGAIVIGRRMFTAARAPGKTTRMPAAGGATIRPSASRSSSSPTTRARRS